jgi:hypothetical protein
LFPSSAGHGRDAQGLWDKPFFFAYLCDPLFGHHTTRNQGLGSSPEQTAGAVAPVTATASAAATLSTPSSSSQSTVPTTVPAPTPTSGALSSSAGVCDVDQEMETLRTAISAINKLRPRFVVVTGSFTHAYPSTTSPSSPSSSTTQSTTPSSTTSPAPPSSTLSATQVTTHAAETLRDLQLNQFMRTMARVSETIPLLFVPGDRDVGEISISAAHRVSFSILSFTFLQPQYLSFCTFHSLFPSLLIHSMFLLLLFALHYLFILSGEVPTPASLAAYRKLFGRDHYGFWYGGVRCLVVNTPLLIHPEVRRSLERQAMLYYDMMRCDVRCYSMLYHNM